ncbi:shikimate dehydrogenase [Fictibacillus phosphorivorans]|uniref:Shikimate dehydrogenase (NADP(+)) n=1 Tax=Fictibacillus phosphorivorans TaxID=1221500 RepID=A0A165P0L1_9BACL|nr:shikimate dehydrogenase [Fictibacillus phosphorivorans]KZE68454.1 shikimate dehydrogenase [Fictibacillus phosphorivorans]
MIKALVIGDPIEHSLSPVMHNEAFKQTGISGTYEKQRVKSEDLEVFIKTLKESNYAGCNVTIPHKVAILPFLDEIEEEARKIGAVNTVVNQGGKLIGYNTDGNGFLLSLKEKISRPLSDLNVLIIGAGGAARSICYALKNENPNQLSIANRSVDRLNSLINDLQDERIEGLTLQRAEENLNRFDVLINTTNAGMYPEVNSVPLKLTHLKEETVVCDIVYNPLVTKWLKEAKERGAITDNGVSMLVMQGAMAFEKWTGIFPDTNKMKQIVIEQLRR